MAQNLNEDLNIVANSSLEIELLGDDLNIIQKLDDEPNDVGGMTAAELKETFDKAGNIIKDYINTKLIPAVIADDATEEARQRAEAARSVWEPYDPEKTYAPMNKVEYEGSSYICTEECTGVLPGEGAQWTLIASRGSIGPPGKDGFVTNGEGLYGFHINEDGDLILTYEGDTPPDYAINAAGELILTVEDGKTVNLGKVAGEDGHSPKIGANNNWWTWDASSGAYVDTGVSASGGAPAQHSHSAEDITSGVLPVARGGTGNGEGKAASATKLATARTVQVDLASDAAPSFDGTANVTPGVSGILPASHGGTGVESIDALEALMGLPAVKEAIAGLGGATKAVQKGSYVGTGTYGETNPVRLEFDFEPAVVMIYGRWGTPDATGLSTGIFFSRGVEEYALTPVDFGSISSSQVYSKFGSNYFEMYNNNSFGSGDLDKQGAQQANMAGETYYYIAIGDGQTVSLPSGAVSSVNGKTGAVKLVAEDVGAVPAPATAQVGQTVRVKAVDDAGRPTEWEAADMAAGGEWELINEVTVTEEVGPIIFTKDSNGNDFLLKKAYINAMCYGIADSTSNALMIINLSDIPKDEGYKIAAIRSGIPAASSTKPARSACYIEKVGETFFSNCSGTASTAYETTPQTDAFFNCILPDKENGEYRGLESISKVCIWSNTYYSKNTFGVGTVIKLWGVRE